MRAYTTSAIVLRRLAYGETDKILTLYSRERGRFSAIAKGARKPISRLSGATEVLTLTRFGLATGKSLDVVSQAEIKESFPRLRSDLNRLAHALYLADLVDHSVEDHESNPILYDLLIAGLYLLQRDIAPELVARWFEVQLIQDLGYAPDFAVCGVCADRVDAGLVNETLALSISHGSVICTLHARPASNSDHSALSGESLALLLDLATLGTDRGDLLTHTHIPDPRSMTLTRLALRRFLRFHLERDLKSLEFLDSISPTTKNAGPV